jgi:hypothetical protein
MQYKIYDGLGFCSAVPQEHTAHQIERCIFCALSAAVFIWEI